jgi:ketosteroid isomerase-like protein
MTRAALVRAIVAVAALAAGVWAFYTFWPSDESAIRRQLDALAATVNEDAAEGLGSVARAAQIGAYFTEDVVVELGQGMSPIQGRESVIGMAARLPAGPGGYDLQFDDVSVTVAPEGNAADVNAAAMLTRRQDPTAERSVDPREVSLGMKKVDGVWRIARATAVDTLRRD